MATQTTSHQYAHLLDSLIDLCVGDVQAFLETLAQRRCRRIELVDVSVRAGTPYFMLISTGEADYIVHAAGAPPLRDQREDLRDICHLLLELPEFESESEKCARGVPLGAQPLVRSLLPTLSPALIDRILGAGGTSEDDR